jgi:hypothetical protein
MVYMSRRSLFANGIWASRKRGANVNAALLIAEGIFRGEPRLLVGRTSLWMGLAKRDSFGILLQAECGNSGLGDRNAAGCDSLVLVRGA